jgi:hypothetical protein
MTVVGGRPDFVPGCWWSAAPLSSSRWECGLPMTEVRTCGIAGVGAPLVPPRAYTDVSTRSPWGVIPTPRASTIRAGRGRQPQLRLPRHQRRRHRPSPGPERTRPSVPIEDGLDQRINVPATQAISPTSPATPSAIRTKVRASGFRGGPPAFKAREILPNASIRPIGPHGPSGGF